MSWQDYVNTQLVGKNLMEAAIAGHDGNLWAKSANFNVTAGEIKTILQNYDTQANLASDLVLRGKPGKGGVHLVRTNQALLVGVYEAPM